MPVLQARRLRVREAVMCRMVEMGMELRPVSSCIRMSVPEQTEEALGTQSTGQREGGAVQSRDPRLQ